MNWDAIGAAGEVAGAVGVILTLVYLSVQIRRSTAQARSDALIKVNDMVRDVCMKLADDPELTKTVLQAGQD